MTPPPDSFILFTMKTYKNPILLCDYSDPDVIRVEDTFYLIASSFNFTPGLPILTSKDLVNWTLINYAAKEIPLPGYEYPQNARGIWAPSIRYHGGEFYIFVGTPDEGLFYTKTKDPYGQWSPLTAIWEGKGFEDPCPLWDDDGRLYVVHGYVKSRIGFNSKLGLLELDPKTMKVMGSDCGDCPCPADSAERAGDRIIFDGTKTQPTIEGPKFYKRNGYYYIFAPAGGVTTGWQTVLRSRNINGPYEERIVLEQGESSVNGPHQGGLVDTPSGQEWFIHFQDRGIYGRICHLQPVKWADDGWPRMGSAVETGTERGEPVLEYQFPEVTGSDNRVDGAVREGATRALEGAALEWQWSANGQENFARVMEKGTIVFSTLDTRKKDDGKAPQKTRIPTLWESANVFTQKISKESFTFEADFDFSKLQPGSRSGMVFLGDDYASVGVECRQEGFSLVYLESISNGGDDCRQERIIEDIPLSSRDVAAVHIVMNFKATSQTGGEAFFTVSAPGFPMEWKSPSYATKNAHWVGGRFGVYAVGQASGEVRVKSPLF